MKKIVVACGSGIATSTAVEAKVKDLLDNNGLSGQYTITKCAIGEAPSKCADADLLVATTAAPAGISCPYVSGVPHHDRQGCGRAADPRRAQEVVTGVPATSPVACAAGAYARRTVGETPSARSGALPCP